jgi:hypothetical protein
MTLQTTLQSPYSRDAWLALLRDLFGPSAALFARPAPIPDPAYAGVFTRVLHLGDLTTADGKTAALLDITVAPSVSLPRNRASVRHLAARLVDGTTRQAILAVFHGDPVPDWRFSFIIREKSLDLATGQTRTAETPARRFTYLLGPNETCRTAAERFALLRDADAGRVTLADIETAFKVDKLTKEFYGELSDWYFWALTQVRFPADIEKDKETRNATMTIRLITRLMFIWFLKKKGVIPDCLFDKTSVDAWLSYTDATGSTYYKAILQNLFFATLNFDPKEGARGFVEWGKKGVLAYRYKRFFKRGAADRFLGVCQAIPFLNGGLFENLDKDVETASPRRLDCFSNTEENEKRLAVPDALFFAKEQIVDLSAFYDDKRKSAVRVKGLFEILNAYNFTVEENTPYDQEVALDPELLGQVFENLLASYNPETRTTARKQTGSFYTPREIVQYMVDESLKAHLLEKVGQAFLPAVSPESCALSDSSPAQTGMSAPPPDLSQRLNALFSYTDEPLHLSEAERAAIVQALFTCKILDPACGSGAFPMGVLQQMVHILNRLDPDNTYLKTQALKQVEEETRAVVNDASALDDKMEKMRDTLRLFDETATRPDYARKLLLIENNIFGVDIQPVAVQIAKLRFFISLIVEQPTQRGADILGRGADIPVCDTDEKDPDGEGMPGASACPTHGGADIPVCAGQAGMPAPPCGDDIRPLPNLETNFVAANTLIGITKPADTLFADDPQVAAIERELKANRHRHFFARTTRTKLACRKEDKRLRDRLQQRLVDLASKLDEQVITDNLARIAKLEAERALVLGEKWEERKQTVQDELFGAPKPEQQALPLRVDVNKGRREQINVAIRHCQSRMAAEEAKTRDNAFTREAEKLALWDPYDQNATSPFFDPEWMFGITDGFDIVIGNPPYVRQESIKDQKPLLKTQNYESFEGTADLFVYFYERGIKTLAPAGHLCFITSNKYFRAGYGEKLRAFLSGKNRIRRLIDFGDAPVFEAVAYPSIILIQRGAPEESHSVRAFTWQPGPEIADFPALCDKRSFPIRQTALRADGWQIECKEVLALLAKLRAAGKPLGDYVNGRFYRGILTGLNEAFVVDRATRDRLIAEHPSSAAILKPFLRGRDVKRWRCAFAEQYLIKIESSENAKHLWSGMEPKRAEAVFAKTYPAIHAFMAPYRQALIKRTDQGTYFWELRSCAYWAMFEQPKIIYPDIYEHQSFAWDTEGFYSVNTTYFIPTGEKWLAALLNSQAVEWFYSQTANRIRGGYLRAFSDYMSQIPIPSATPAQQAALAALVDRILAAKVGQAFLPAGQPSSATFSSSSPSQTGMSAPPSIATLEAEIDRLVYGLYGLTAPEVAVVEGKQI